MIVGLTGSIATGKSTVARAFEKRGIPVVDADVAARVVVEKGQPALRKIKEAFGPSILHDDGTLNRQALGARIFTNDDERKVLNEIMHPAIREAMEMKKREWLEKGAPIVMMDIPLLFENDLEQTVDRIVVVTVSESTQLKRLMARNDLTEEEARARIASQWPVAEKAKRAHDVIDNDGTLEETDRQVSQIIEKWQFMTEK
ncbi:MAG TPA: dephospho-CoA kinase [Savagea sp.]